VALEIMPGHLPAPCQGLVPEVGPSGVAARLVIPPTTATFRDMATVGYARVSDVPPSTNFSRERPRRPLPDRSRRAANRYAAPASTVLETPECRRSPCGRPPELNS